MGTSIIVVSAETLSHPANEAIMVRNKYNRGAQIYPYCNGAYILPAQVQPYQPEI